MSAKLGCCPAKPTLLTLAILGILSSAGQLTYPNTLEVKIGHVTYISYCVLLIVAGFHKNVNQLNFAKQVSLILCLLYLVPLFVLPVYFAVVSGSLLDSLLQNQTELGSMKSLQLELNINGDPSSRHETMITAMAMGYGIQILLLFAIGYQYLIFALVKAIWLHELDERARRRRITLENLKNNI